MALPVWFKEKYEQCFLFPGGTLVTSSVESKFYEGKEFFKDYQKALIEVNALENISIVCVVLAEDDMITKVRISKEAIQYELIEDGTDWDGVWCQ